MVEGKLQELKEEVGTQGGPTDYKKGKLVACEYRHAVNTQSTPCPFRAHVCVSSLVTYSRPPLTYTHTPLLGTAPNVE